MKRVTRKKSSKWLILMCLLVTFVMSIISSIEAIAANSRPSVKTTGRSNVTKTSAMLAAHKSTSVGISP